MLGLLLLGRLLIFVDHSTLTTNHTPAIRTLTMGCLGESLARRPSIRKLSGLETRSVYSARNFGLRLRLLRHSLVATFVCVRWSCFRVNHLRALIQLTCFMTVGIFGRIHSFLVGIKMRDFFVLKGLSDRLVSRCISRVLVRLWLSQGTFLFVEFAF